MLDALESGIEVVGIATVGSNIETGTKEPCLRSLEILANSFELSLPQLLKRRLSYIRAVNDRHGELQAESGIKPVSEFESVQSKFRAIEVRTVALPVNQPVPPLLAEGIWCIFLEA